MKACPRCRAEFPGGVMPPRCRCGMRFETDNRDARMAFQGREGEGTILVTSPKRSDAPACSLDKLAAQGCRNHDEGG